MYDIFIYLYIWVLFVANVGKYIYIYTYMGVFRVWMCFGLFWLVPAALEHILDLFFYVKCESKRQNCWSQTSDF